MEENNNKWKIINGKTLILLVAAHNFPQYRNGKIKPRDLNTGLLVEILSKYLDCWGIISTGLQIDPNYYVDSHFRKKIKELIEKKAIKLIVDIHGRKANAKDLIAFYPNKEFQKQYFLPIRNFPIRKFKSDGQVTISEDLEISQIPSLQIEIRKDGRVIGSEGNKTVVSLITELLKSLPQLYSSNGSSKDQ